MATTTPTNSVTESDKQQEQPNGHATNSATESDKQQEQPKGHATNSVTESDKQQEQPNGHATKSCEGGNAQIADPAPADEAEMTFMNNVVARGDEALRLAAALAISKEEGIRVMQEIIDSGSCEPRRSWLLQTFSTLLNESNEPVIVEHGSPQEQTGENGTNAVKGSLQTATAEGNAEEN